MGCCTSMCAACSKGDDSGSPGKQYKWEQDLMTNTIMKSGKVSKAAIVSLSDGGLRAAGPRSFKPHSRGVQDIIEALKGDSSDLASEGLKLGSGVPNMVPGKLDEGKAIYATDGDGGGVTIFKTKECVLIIVYKSDPAQATRLASEVAEYMEENDR